MMISHASRSDGVSARRLPSEVKNAAMIRIQSRQKYTSRPTAEPTWSMTTKASQGDSRCDCQETMLCQRNRVGNRTV